MFLARRFAIGLLMLACSAVAAGDELSEARRIAGKYSAEVEALLWDSTRVDLLSATHAWEVDWPQKWAEAIGQAQYYSIVTGKKPGVILLVKDPRGEERFVYRCQTVCARLGIELAIERVSNPLP